MYYQTEIVAGKTVEVYKSYTKGASKKKREQKKNKTQEQMQEANRRNAEKKLTRIFNANFVDGDLHIVLTYKKNERPTKEEAKKILAKFWRKLKAEYKKHKKELKYIVVTEFKNKNIHHHIIINNPDGLNVVKMIKNLWNGIPKITPLWSNGQYKELAEYLIKETDKTFREKESGFKQRYSRSRNLVIPKPKTKIVKADRWSKNPKPKKGYYIDQDTVVNGINKWSGREYQHYTMIELSRDGTRREKDESNLSGCVCKKQMVERKRNGSRDNGVLHKRRRKEKVSKSRIM